MGSCSEPIFLPGLTIKQAAAPHDTLVVVAVIVGAAVLFPSLALLFRLVLGGQLDYGEETASSMRPSKAIISASNPAFWRAQAGACFVAGIGFLTLAEAGWAHAIGVASLFAFMAVGFFAVAPADTARERT